VGWCNAGVRDAPRVDGDTSIRGGLFIAFELADRAFQAYALHYEPGLSKKRSYDPRRFTWIFDEGGEARDSVKFRDNQTGRIVIWPHF
jgi:hypothetical protein